MNGADLAKYLQAARSGIGLLRSLAPQKEEEPKPPQPPQISEDLHQLREELSAGESSETPTTIEHTYTPATQESVAPACVACALHHYATSAGLLNEAVRFKKEGITSNEILDRIAKVLEEQNALERVDLTPENIRGTPDWERRLAETALEQSRELRHMIENITSIDELEQAAADTESYYRKLNRQWYKGRFQHLGKEKSEAIESRISPENKEGAK